MNAEEILEFIRSGGRVRWLPKSIVYNVVRGPDTRTLYVGPRMATNEEGLTIRLLQRQGLLVGVEKRSGILQILLPEDHVKRKKARKR